MDLAKPSPCLGGRDSMSVAPRTARHERRRPSGAGRIKEFTLDLYLPDSVVRMVFIRRASPQILWGRTAADRPLSSPPRQIVRAVLTRAEMATTTPPLAVPSSFVRTMPVTPADCVNRRACLQSILTGVAFHDQQGLMRRSGNKFVEPCAAFSPFGHKACLGMQAAGRCRRWT